MVKRSPGKQIHCKIHPGHNPFFIWTIIIAILFSFSLSLQENSFAADKLVMVTQAAGLEGDGDSKATDITPDGKVMVLTSLASNLSDKSSGAFQQIMHYSRGTGTWKVVSSTPGGVEGNGDSGHPDITNDNRYVVFHSFASNLGGTGSFEQIFRKDLHTGEVILVSKTAAGVEANDDCRRPFVSEDGSKVVFESWATNLGGTGLYRQVFLKDLNTGEVKLISSSATDVESNADTDHPYITADGRYVTFHSAGSSLHPSMNGIDSQVLRKNVATGAVDLVSCKADGTPGNGNSRHGTITSDGRYVSFYSAATNFVSPAPTVFDQVYLKDLETGTIKLVSSSAAGEAGNAGAGNWGQNPVSMNGRYVSFVSTASNLLPEATGVAHQVFRKDMISGELVLVSANAAGTESNFSWRPAMTPDGCYISFYSDSMNLVSSPAASGTVYQVYIRDMNCFPWIIFTPAITGM